MNQDDGYFDERVAAVYDSYEDREEFAAEDIKATVDFLADLAGKGPALEFGIGTGRIGLPLSRRGVPTQGIDLSRAMVAKLKAKPGGQHVAVTIGDFATTSVEGSFHLVYLVCNTIMNLTTQRAQVACFRNAASHLRPGGHFVIKVMVPELQWLPPRGHPPCLRGQRQTLGDRRIRGRKPAPSLAPLRQRQRRPMGTQFDAVSLCLAVAARCDGGVGGAAALRALGVVAPGTIHE